MKIRKTVTEFALRSAYKVGLFELGRAARRNKVAILCYHRFASPSWADGAIPANLFEAHLKYLKERFTVIPLKTLSSLASESGRVKNPAALTVDDGYGDFLKVAVPLLEKYELPATLFVTTRFVDGEIWLWPDILRYTLLKTEKAAFDVFGDGSGIPLRTPNEKGKVYLNLVEICKKVSESDKFAFLEELARRLDVTVPALPPEEFRPVSWDALRRLNKDLFEIGSHTLTHPILSRVPIAQAKTEIEESKRRIEEALEREVTTFAYPNGTRGDYAQEHKDILKQCGYQVAVTTNFGFSTAETDPFEMNRMGAAYDLPRFAKSMSGFESLRRRISDFSFNGEH